MTFYLRIQKNIKEPNVSVYLGARIASRCFELRDNACRDWRQSAEFRSHRQLESKACLRRHRRFPSEETVRGRAALLGRQIVRDYVGDVGNEISIRRLGPDYK